MLWTLVFLNSNVNAVPFSNEHHSSSVVMFLYLYSSEYILISSPALNIQNPPICQIESYKSKHGEKIMAKHVRTIFTNIGYDGCIIIINIFLQNQTNCPPFSYSPKNLKHGNIWIRFDFWNFYFSTKSNKRLFTKKSCYFILLMYNHAERKTLGKFSITTSLVLIQMILNEER